MRLGIVHRSLRAAGRKGGFMSLFEGSEVMDLEQPNPSQEPKGGSSCSICLDLVLDLGKRSIATLQCGHEFHLDCIGSAFNAKGAMQCPNCRKVEKGQWLYANGHRPSTDFDLDGWVTEDVYDLSYSELPFAFQWCPIRGLTQLASLFEEGESHSNSLYGDHSSASSNTQICPYLALHGFPHAVHTAPSSATDSVPDNGRFHRHPTSLSGDLINSHNFSATEPHGHNWHQPPSLSFPVSANADQSASHLASRLSRNDSGSQQRLGSFVHPHAFLHEPITRSGSNLVASLGRPVMGEVRGHSHGHGSRIYQQSAASSSLRTPPFALVRRPRPRGLAVFSPAAPSSSADIGGFYGYPVSGSVSRNHQDGESIGRNVERFYGWGREGGSTPLPWIPTEGESQWWGPFHPNQNPPPGSTDSMSGNLFHQRSNGERFNQSRPESGYHRMLPPGAPPPPHM